LGSNIGCIEEYTRNVKLIFLGYASILVTYLFLVIFILLSLTGVSQYTVTGIVTDKETDKPLIDVNIQIDELHKGAVSDINGKYIIKNLPKGELILGFSYVGFKTTYENIYISGNNIILNVALEMLVIEGRALARL